MQAGSTQRRGREAGGAHPRGWSRVALAGPARWGVHLAAAHGCAGRHTPVRKGRREAEVSTVKSDLADLHRTWGERGPTIRDRLFLAIRVSPSMLPSTAAVLERLPVSPEATGEKRTLVAELRSAYRQWETLDRLLETLADQVKRLPVLDTL